MTIGLVLSCAAAIMAICEWWAPKHDLPTVEGFRWRAIVLSGIQIAAAVAGSFLIGPQLRQWSLLDAQALGPWLGSLWGYLAITFIYYWWHRARHSSGLLWRMLHQVHHSPARLELLTTYYKHPLESISNVLFGGLLMYVLLGLTPVQAAIVTTLCGLAEFFYHWNVSTPRQLRYLVQRPEAHRLHHQLGVHAGNYADLPIWDLLFGTYRDPDAPAVQVQCGFAREEEQRLSSMLRFQQVTP